MQKERYKHSKDERLKSRKSIKNLFDCGKIIYHYPYKVLFNFKENENTNYLAQIGISASKRNFKHAVDRNNIKRKIRESYRLNKHLLYNELKKRDQKLNFFVIYTAKQDLDFSVIHKEMKNLIVKIIDKMQQINT